MTVEPPAGGGERTPTSFERGRSDPLGRCDRGEGGVRVRQALPPRFAGHEESI